MSQKTKCVYFHMNQLGDMLFSLPFLSAARKAWPDRHLASFARDSFRGLLDSSGFVDEVVVRKNGGFNFIENIAALRRGSFDCSIHFSESPRSSLTALLSGIPEMAGFSTAALSLLYKVKAERIGVPSMRNNARLAEKLGLKALPEDYSGLLKVPRKALELIDGWVESRGLNKAKLVAVAPGASRRRRDKLWQASKWVQVIKELSLKGYEPVLCGGPADAGELRGISEACGGKAGVYDGVYGIDGLAALFSTSVKFLGIDSGAMHLAAALKVPVVALFGPTDPLQVGPMPLEKNIVVKKNYMDEIEVKDVLEAAGI
ncbi:MAG: hypothetical protein A2339_07665 [Elusimicrobia bacterium RIFOXYB12_FULL_50_12]|nr:MAG: hypothetical protein A2278_03065 [Elusimicrobia bacterium RIFOXYA12_FULL_49_49]OGS09658.1 MAG: hypothetical protein A2386_01125 [Elusimicrobia bacterium RIFOXYB1_FULL_48_9]OGS15545.1 MAG: hypothetical protein A2251_03315 [Elusimicrobia bacterium RIFOXYA2_FULL_47_53]OGS26899.1 MAG: hypothetical protein A2339_07665 [Elusimicrobia bacterium RIFOXYB12_FULL_50_12]OGS30644.1 MAG: hypothetical protein A2323_07120 [Elusimicrobia bacterium RIFOXYB2_FULL_46_23]